MRAGARGRQFLPKNAGFLKESPYLSSHETNNKANLFYQKHIPPYIASSLRRHDIEKRVLFINKKNAIR